MASEKVKFVRKVRASVTSLITAALGGIDAREIYNDREYFPAGSDPIIDEDVASEEVTANDVLLAMQFFENFLKMLDNLSITTADYRKSLNMMRNDK